MKTVAFCTLGCKVNQYETNAIEQQFLNNNYGITPPFIEHYCPR